MSIHTTSKAVTDLLIAKDKEATEIYNAHKDTYTTEGAMHNSLHIIGTDMNHGPDTLPFDMEMFIIGEELARGQYAAAHSMILNKFAPKEWEKINNGEEVEEVAE